MIDVIDYSSCVTTTSTTTTATKLLAISEADDTRFVEEAIFAATSFIDAYRETNEELEMFAFFISLDTNYYCCSLIASMLEYFDDANYSGNDSDIHSVYYFSRLKHHQNMIIRDKRRRQQNHLQMTALLYLRIDLLAFFRYSILIFQGILVLV